MEILTFIYSYANLEAIENNEKQSMGSRHYKEYMYLT